MRYNVKKQKELKNEVNRSTFPYQNLFITARPGMGATTLAVNIINKHLDEGKKCLVFAGTHDYSPKYIERVKIIRENGDMNDLLRPSIEKYGNLSVVGNPNISLFQKSW